MISAPFVSRRRVRAFCIAPKGVPPLRPPAWCRGRPVPAGSACCFRPAASGRCGGARCIRGRRRLQDPFAAPRGRPDPRCRTAGRRRAALQGCGSCGRLGPWLQVSRKHSPSRSNRLSRRSPRRTRLACSLRRLPEKCCCRFGRLFRLPRTLRK